jgi:para-nitrobenzyl esterase
VDDAVVQTTNGPVSGSPRNGIFAFRGVPYGADTGGDNRFGRPRPPEPWTDVRECVRYGTPAPQQAGAMVVPDVMSEASGGNKAFATTEDCLTLSLWTPAADDARRPVMVWLHGGGYITGSGVVPTTHGERLSRRGDAVVVCVNHRLGALGFLHLADHGGPELAASGMHGILDLQLALEWVRDNIAGFGGDPGNVTIFGESGGGGKVSTLLAMPGARGLFHRAIVQSGPGLRGTPADRAGATAAQFMEKLGVTTVDELRQVPVDRIVAEQGTLGWGPVVDGDVLPRDPYEPDAAPSAHGVPLLIGWNKDEMTLFLQPRKGFGEWDHDKARRVAAPTGGARSTLYDRYRELHPEWSPTDVAVAVTSEQFRLGSITQAERHVATGTPTYVYQFAWETPVMGGILKSAHGAEVSFAFDNLPRDPMVGGDEKAQLLADAVSDAWLAFARTGDPNHAGLPAWPVYDTERRPTMVLDHTCALVDDPLGAERRLSDDLQLDTGI